MNSKKIVLGLAIVSVSALLGYFGTSMILGSKGASDNQKQPTDTSTTRTTSTDNSNGVDAMLIKLVDADKCHCKKIWYARWTISYSLVDDFGLLDISV